VATPEAAAIVRSFKPSGPVSVLADGVDVEVLRSRTRRGGPPTVVLSTALGELSEGHDALEFIRRVMPAVRKELPEVRLVISSHEAPANPALTHRIPGVDVDAPRQDIRAVLARAAVAVAPLWTSGNVRQMVLQPMGAGIPMVATSQAALAVGAEPERDLLVADDPRDFAIRILQLLRDRDLATGIGSRGQILVSTKYAWNVTASGISTLVENVTKLSQPAPVPKADAELHASR
jgi:glycosyltransferase involved in cell wall biosynthesis